MLSEFKIFTKDRTDFLFVWFLNVLLSKKAISRTGFKTDV